jgi:hypothetical protein
MIFDVGVEPVFSRFLPSGDDSEGREESEVGDKTVGEGVSVFVLGNLSVDDIAGVLMTDGGL